MGVDLAGLLKVIWNVLPLALGGFLSYVVKDYKSLKDIIKQNEKDIVAVKATMITSHDLDEALDRKVNQFNESIKDIKRDIASIRAELKTDLDRLFDKILELKP